MAFSQCFQTATSAQGRCVAERFILVAMIRALFRKQDSEPRELEVEKRASLRHVQKLLCSIFAERFPCMKASVVVRGEHFASFLDRPFFNCEDGDEIEVAFSPTDDPFFYDLNDRSSHKISLEDEMAWEEARASGSTTLDLQAWLRARFVAEE